MGFLFLAPGPEGGRVGRALLHLLPLRRAHATESALVLARLLPARALLLLLLPLLCLALNLFFFLRGKSRPDGCGPGPAHAAGRHGAGFRASRYEGPHGGLVDGDGRQVRIHSQAAARRAFRRFLGALPCSPTRCGFEGRRGYRKVAGVVVSEVAGDGLLTEAVGRRMPIGELFGCLWGRHLPGGLFPGNLARGCVFPGYVFLRRFCLRRFFGLGFHRPRCLGRGGLRRCFRRCFRGLVRSGLLCHRFLRYRSLRPGFLRYGRFRCLRCLTRHGGCVRLRGCVLRSPPIEEGLGQGRGRFEGQCLEGSQLGRGSGCFKGEGFKASVSRDIAVRRFKT